MSVIRAVWDKLKKATPETVIAGVAAGCVVLVIAMTAVIWSSQTERTSGVIRATCKVKAGAPPSYTFNFASVSGSTETGDLILPASTEFVEFDCSDPSNQTAPLRMPAALRPQYFADSKELDYLTWSGKVRTGDFTTATVRITPAHAVVSNDAMKTFTVYLCDNFEQFTQWALR